MSGLVSTVAPYLARAAAYSYGLFIYSLSALLTLWDKTSSQNQERHDKDALDKGTYSPFLSFYMSLRIDSLSLCVFYVALADAPLLLCRLIVHLLAILLHPVHIKSVS